MIFVTTQLGDIAIIGTTLLVFCVINFPRTVYIVTRLSSSHSWISNKNRLACNWFDLGFITNGFVFGSVSIFFRALALPCIAWLSLNILLSLCSSLMLLLFLRNRLIIFVSSAGKWIKLPRLFRFYPLLIALSVAAYLSSLVVFIVTFHASADSEPPTERTCDFGRNRYFVAIFVPSTAMLCLLYCFDLLTFISILGQCRAIVNTLRKSMSMSRHSHSKVAPASINVSVSPAVAHSASPRTPAKSYPQRSATQASGKHLSLSSQASIRNNSRRINKMVYRLLRPAVLLAIANITSFAALLVVDVTTWTLLANANLVLISLCVLSMYREPASHLKAIATCNIALRRTNMLALISPSKRTTAAPRAHAERRVSCGPLPDHLSSPARHRTVHISLSPKTDPALQRGSTASKSDPTGSFSDAIDN